MEYEDSQAREWTALYAEPQTTLAVHGREDVLGPGDIWLIDDNYGSP